SYSEQREQTCCDTKARHTLRFAPAADVVVLPVQRRHIFEHMILKSPVRKICRRRRTLRKTVHGLILPYHDEPIRIMKRQRAKKDRIGEAEYRGVRANP